MISLNVRLAQTENNIYVNYGQQNCVKVERRTEQNDIGFRRAAVVQKCGLGLLRSAAIGAERARVSYVVRISVRE